MINLNNSRLINATKCQKVDRVPMWLMRQAGRFLPEYRKLREKNSFTKMYKTPELACEVSMQPYKRFGFDGVIYFSDILVIPEAMGLSLNFDNNEPSFAHSITSKEDIDKLIIPEPQESLDYILNLITLLKKELPNDIPLIGFTGAPLTLSCYMIERKSKNLTWHLAKKFMYAEPLLFHQLMSKTTSAIIKYMKSQIDYGVNIIQVFDSWAGAFSSEEYEKFALSYMSNIFDEIKGYNKEVPLIYYVNNVVHLLQVIKNINFDVLSVDSRCPFDLLTPIIKDNVAIQGNLDSAILLTNKSIIEENVAKTIHAGKKKKGYIFNLGHGILPETPIENVEYLVEFVRKHGSYGE